jgi:PAS domain S-box-containing protein
MKKNTIILISCLLLALFVNPISVSAETTIKMGVYQNRPLLFKDNDGNIKGIFADILAYIADEEDWNIEYVNGSWSQGLQNLKSADIDILGPIAYSQERKKDYDFTYENVLTNWGQIYVNEHSKIESILDLRGRKIAVLQNDVYFLNLRHLVKQFGINCRFIEAFEYEDVLKLVEIGKCDAGLVNYLYGHQFERDYDIHKSAIILSPQKIHFAVPKGKYQAIINALDHHLSALKMDSGSIYHQSLSKWIGVESKPPGIGWLLGISAGALLLLLIVLFLNQVLRAKVRKRTGELNIKNQALLDEIEQRKKAEYALQENEKEYRSVFENTGTATILIEEDMTISKINAKAKELTGCSEADIEGKIKTIDFVAQEDRERIIQYHGGRRKHEGEYPSEYTFKIVDKHGHTKNVFIQTSMIPGTKRSIASMIDITSRVQAETALRRSEEKYRNILENIEDGYFELDLDGNLIFFNNSLCKITGHSREELIGIKYSQNSSPDTVEKLFQVFNQISRTAKPLTLADLEIDLQDDRIITVDLSATPIKTPDDQMVGFRGLIRDVSERKRAEKERRKLEKKLQQAQKMKAIGTLAGGVAHDLNNILSGIVSYPDLILMDLPRESPLFEPIQTIQESGKKAAAIVQDLLTLARRGVSISEVLNLNDVITEYLDSPQLAKLKSFHPLVEIQNHLDSALLNIKGSPIHLSKTVMTENQYIDKPIRGYDDVEEGDYVVLTVSDTGMGIHPDEINKIFEPFYTKKVMGRSGTGLGMAVVWGTVKDHKGYIHVESGLGNGTVFKLYFPVTRKQQAQHQYDKNSVDYQGKGESVLVVDDAPQQRDIASKILSQLGYSVKTVESGEEAVVFLKKNTVDLIVLDMIMPPGIDGLETYERIIELNPTQKAIIASGYSETGRVKKAQQLGAGKYVKKPYTVQKIGLAVKSELEKQQRAA